MRLWLAAVGKARTEPSRPLFDDYVRRLSSPLTLREVEVRKPLPVVERRRQESALLLAAVPASATLVVLDEHGETLTSLAFARRLAVWRDQGIADLAFFIGGADGHDSTLRDRAHLLLSFGAMTWPHLLVRAMLAEQLFRAQTIHSGHPYHREG